MAASTSSFTKLSAPLRHLLLRQSAVTLTGKIAGEQALPVFSPYQKPILAGAATSTEAINMMLFGRVDSPVTQSIGELAMKKKDDDSADDAPSDEDSGDDVDDSCSDFDDEFVDSSDDADETDEDEE